MGLFPSHDREVSVGPSYATKRMEAAESMMAFVQAFPAAAPIIGDMIARNMDWPGAEDIADRLKKTIPPEIIDEELSPEEQQQRDQQIQAQQAEQQKQQQMMDASFQLDMQGKMAEVRAKMAKAARDMAEAEAQDIENDATESGIADLLERMNG